MSLQDILTALENLGEPKVVITAHSVETYQGAINIKKNKEVCFVLDALKEKKKKDRLPKIKHYVSFVSPWLSSGKRHHIHLRCPLELVEDPDEHQLGGCVADEARSFADIPFL